MLLHMVLPPTAEAPGFVIFQRGREKNIPIGFVADKVESSGAQKQSIPTREKAHAVFQLGGTVSSGPRPLLPSSKHGRLTNRT